mgnify:CR=1 FL=1|tara:strand:+ start:658 stop:2220 length:1563 start_codon:yes stop_codon:yes gene_type:complete
MSIIEQQKELEYYPDETLAQEMMQPTGIAPSFLVATEIKRRNDMRNAYQSQANPTPQTSVVEEQAMELGGIPNVDPNAMQQQMMQQPMPQQQMPQNAPMPMREGGAIRHQGGQTIDRYQSEGYIDPNLIAMGLTIDEEGKIVPIEDEEGLQGPFGNTIAGPEGWLLDTDLYTGGEDNPYAGRPLARTGWIAADLAKLKLANTGFKAAKGAYKKAGGFKGMTKGIRDKYDEGIAGLRSRLGGTGPRPAMNVPNPANPGGISIGTTTQAPTSITGRAADIALNNPATTAVLGGGAVASVLPDTETGTNVEAKEVPLTKEEQVELSSLMSQSAYNAEELFGEGGYDAFKKVDPRTRLDTLRRALVAGKMPTEVPSFDTTDTSEGGIASSRSQLMDELTSMLGGGDQALRDQQGAALVQLGAGIAAGDLAGGLSAAGKEVSALKAARSGEKIKAIMALIEMQYKEGLLSANRAKSIIDQITLLQENSMGDANATAKIDQLYNQLSGLGSGANNMGIQTASSYLG